MKSRALIIIAVMSLTLAACGFSPVYKSTSGVQQGLEKIYISTIPNRDGQFLRNKLLDSFYQSYDEKNAAYVLKITDLTTKKTDLDITKSADATRAQLRVRARLLLIDKQSKEVLISRQITSITSYNILGSQFTTRVSEQTARENALIDLSEQIQRNVTLYFKR